MALFHIVISATIQQNQANTGNHFCNSVDIDNSLARARKMFPPNVIKINSSCTFFFRILLAP